MKNELATRSDLAETRALMKADLTEATALMKVDLADLRTELAGIRAEIANSRVEMIKWNVGAMTALAAIFATISRLN